MRDGLYYRGRRLSDNNIGEPSLCEEDYTFGDSGDEPTDEEAAEWASLLETPEAEGFALDRGVF